MTEHEIDLSNLTRSQKELHDLLLQTELGGVTANAYKLSHAGTGQSGYSVGHSQVDLSKNTTYADLVGGLVDKIEGISDADKETIKNSLKEKGISPTIETNLEKINSKLQTPEGRAVVDEIHTQNLKDVEGKVQAVINAATLEARAFLDTPLGRALVADNINQYGRPTSMTKFMSGKAVTFTGQKHALRGPLDIETYVDYVGGYFFSQLEPADMQRRMEEIANFYDVPELAEAAAAMAAELAPVSRELHRALDNKNLTDVQRNAIAKEVAEDMKSVRAAFRTGYDGFRALGLGHKAAMTYGQGKLDLVLEVRRQYDFALQTGRSRQDARKFAMQQTQAMADGLVRDSARAVGSGMGLNPRQTNSLVEEVSNKGLDWWDAAIGSAVDAKENDPYGHVNRVTAEITADLVRDGISLPNSPEPITNAYDFAHNSGQSEGKAKDFAYGVAKGVAEANEMFDADVRALKEAASWNALAGKFREQNINRQSDQPLEDLTRLETRVREILGVPIRDQAKLTQVASLTDIPISNPVAAESKKRQETGESLWSAVQQETDARRAAELEQDTRELERAYGIEQRRDAAARATDDVATSVSPAKTGNLGGIVDEMNDAVSKALADRNRTSLVGARGLGVLGGGPGADLLGGGKASQQAPAARRKDSEDEIGQRSYSDEAYDPSLGFTGNLARDAAALGKIGTEAGSEQLAENRKAGVKAQKEAANSQESRVICTELVAQGRMAPELYLLDLRFAEERLSAAHLRGYHLWAVPLVRWMRRSQRVSALVAGPALWRAEEIAHLLGERQRGSLCGRIVRLIGEPLCRLIGCWVPETDYSKLYEQETNA